MYQLMTKGQLGGPLQPCIYMFLFHKNSVKMHFNCARRVAIFTVMPWWQTCNARHGLDTSKWVLTTDGLSYLGVTEQPTVDWVFVLRYSFWVFKTSHRISIVFYMFALLRSNSSNSFNLHFENKLNTINVINYITYSFRLNSIGVISNFSLPPS